MDTKKLNRAMDLYRDKFGSTYNYFDFITKCGMLNSGKRVLRALASTLGMEKGTFDVRSNEGGSAVSGEVTLHGENLYVQLFVPPWTNKGEPVFLIRNCKGRKDYCGGRNHYCSLLDSSYNLADLCGRVVEKRG